MHNFVYLFMKHCSEILSKLKLPRLHLIHVKILKTFPVKLGMFYYNSIN